MDTEVKSYRVKSDSKEGTFYIVRHFLQSGKFVCECPSYTFHAEGYECKHIKKVIKYLDMKKKGQL